MIEVYENLLNRSSPRIAAIAFGDKFAEGTIEEIARTSCVVVEPVLHSNASRRIDEMMIDTLKADLLYVVIDADEMNIDNLDTIDRIITKCGAMAIGICIGDISCRYLFKFETITKAFYFEATDRIQKYVALITTMINRALQPDSLVGIDLSDLRMCFTGTKNRVWFGKSYGKEKGGDIAYQFKKSDWYKNESCYSCKAMLVIIAGDISLYDANEAFSAISYMLKNDVLLLVSVCFDKDAYEEMSMIVIDSK